MKVEKSLFIKRGFQELLPMAGKGVKGRLDGDRYPGEKIFRIMHGTE